MKEVILSCGDIVQVSNEDEFYVQSLIVRKHTARELVYFIVSTYPEDYLHVLIAKRAGHEVKNQVDHKDRDGYNLQRENLRPCTQSQNLMNQGLRRTSKSGFKGVSFEMSRRKWVAQIQGTNLGRFNTVLEAAKAYDKAAVRLFGEFARLNFYDGVHQSIRGPKVKAKKLHPDAKLPVRVNNSAGYDVFSIGDWVVEPCQVVAIGTGIALEIPAKHVGILSDRSGLALKGISTKSERLNKDAMIKWLTESDQDWLCGKMHVLGGVIDEEFRGEIKVLLANTGKESYQVKKGDRVAQMLVLPINQDEVIEADLSPVITSDVLSATIRGESGFGSSGT